MQALFDAMPLISMILFLLIFLGVVVYVGTDRRRRHIDRMAAAALEDSDLDAPQGGDRG